MVVNGLRNKSLVLMPAAKAPIAAISFYVTHSQFR